MATGMSTTRSRSTCLVLIVLLFYGSDLFAQRFSDESGFRPHPLRVAKPSVIAETVREFLSEQVLAGDVEVVGDEQGGRLLVKGSASVQKQVQQFLKATDRPTSGQTVLAQQTAVPQQPVLLQQATPQKVLAQLPGSVVGYPVSSIDDMAQRLAELREAFGLRTDVRIAADERTQQIVVHAPAEVHKVIAASWNKVARPQGQAQAQGTLLPNTNPNAVTNQQGSLASLTEQIALQNITWQELLRTMRGFQGANSAIRAPQEGLLEMTVASATGEGTSLQIDQAKQTVQIAGSNDGTNQWKRVVKALDRDPAKPGEEKLMGRLGDAQPATITRTIAMLGGAGGQAPGLNTPVAPRPFAANQPPQQAQQQVQVPFQMAQAGQAPLQGLGNGETAALVDGGGDLGGSFLGPVRIEFLEGTDIFIVRGQKQDVERVMRIIKDIETMTVDTEPEVLVLELEHANSEAVSALINQLNQGVLQPRLGDVSVTPLVKPNALLIIGREAGVNGMTKLVKDLDVEVEASAPFRVIKLKYLPAVDAERTVNNLYNQTQQQGATADAVNTLGPRVRAVADFRSNSLAVSGSPRDVAEIAALMSEIDVKGSATVSEVRVFQLKNALAEEIEEVLNNTLGTDQADTGGQGGGQFGGGGAGAGGNAVTQPFSSRRALMLKMKVFDEKTRKMLDDTAFESDILSNVVVSSNARVNSVIVTAPGDSMDLIAEIIRQLDELPAQEAEIRVFTIVNGDAAALIEMLDTLFAQADTQDGPLVQSAAGTGESTLVPLRFALDGRTNSIIASGNGADLRVVEAILLKLDASDVRSRRTSVYELQIQQAVSVANAITDFVAQKRAAIQGIAPDTLTQYDLLDQEVVVVAEPDSNKLIISATERYYEEIIEVIRNLDKRPDMIMIQVLIAEVKLNSTEELGVELGIQDSLLFNRSVDGVPGFNFNNQALGNNSTSAGSARDQVAGQALSDLGLSRANNELGFGGLVLSASSESVSVLVRALQESRRLDVLSRPQVMMLNNTTGEVQVGANVPYITDTQNNGLTITNTITFQPVGLILSVTPRISPDGLVVLDVFAEKSDLGAEEDGVPISVSDGQVLRAPQINTTRARTFVTARDGQTVILGGLITKERSAFERKVPYLGDVPFFGRLFRTDGISEERTELMIILTPHIIRDDSDIDRINSEEQARMSWCLGNVIETHGDIGPGYTVEENAVYSDMAPSATDSSYESTPIFDDQQVYQEAAADGASVSPGTFYPQAPSQIAPIPESVPVVQPATTLTPPTSAAPPLPSGLPTLPQARNSKSILLKSPSSASLFPGSKATTDGVTPINGASRNNRLTPINRVTTQRPRTETQQPAQRNWPTVQPVEFQSRAADAPATKRAFYRFDEVPEQ